MDAFVSISLSPIYFIFLFYYKYIFLLADASLGFSPLVVCILQKCLRLLDSKSETGSPEKSMISLYVSNTLTYILQTQVTRVSELCLNFYYVLKFI